VSTPSKKFFWIAVRDSAVPHWPIPATVAEMRNSAIHIENNQTVWSIGDPEPLPGLANNYDVLIGFKTAAAQQAAVRKLLRGPIEEARAEYQRTLQQETVIWGRQ
jgi:hypothetical protein